MQRYHKFSDNKNRSIAVRDDFVIHGNSKVLRETVPNSEAFAYGMCYIMQTRIAKARSPRPRAISVKCFCSYSSRCVIRLSIFFFSPLPPFYISYFYLIYNSLIHF